jgi:nucleoside-diphosphate-sugar epimerase/glycosyltransferase involved in cell wall biosynthesis
MPSVNSRLGIVGASGFVGQALVEQLADLGDGCPRLFGRRAGRVGACPIEVLEIKPETFRGLDCIIHLSGITSSRASEDDLKHANVDLAVEVAAAAAAAGVKRMVFASSLHVHGKAAADPISPSSPINPDNAYGRSKAAAEAALSRIAEQTGMDLVVLRPPMVYGATANNNFALLARLIRTGLPLPFALARGERSFCSVGNLVSAIRYAAGATSPPSVLIPADPEDFDTPSLVRTMAAAMGRSVRLVPVPKMFLAMPLAAVGRAEMVTSLFEPLKVDRAHWGNQGWRPVENGSVAVSAAVTGGTPASPLLLYVTNSTPYFFSHRIAFAREAARRGFRIALAGGDVIQHKDLLDAAGILPWPIRGGARGIDPLGDLRGALDLARAVRTLQPKAVHATALKAIFLTALASFRTKLPRTVCIVTGLGATYINTTWKTRAIRAGLEAVMRPMMRRRETRVVFQNSTDREYLASRGLVTDGNALLIPGSGVNTEVFDFVEEPASDEPLVIFPARLLISKGVREFIAAATRLKADGLKARFALVGDLDPANPDAMQSDELEAVRAQGLVEVRGFRSDMPEVLASAHIVCLPSYREGLPKSLIEAAAVGRAIVTTDVPGCRDVVADGVNGLLVPVRDPVAVAKAIATLVLKEDLRRAYGLAGRRRALQEFAERKVVSATVDLYSVI